MDRIGFRLLSVVGFQFLLLFSVIGFKQYTVWTGETVVLKVEPVDPRSPFSGDYVHLNYEISRLDTASLGGDRWFGSGQTVYVELAKGDDGYAHAVALYHDHRSGGASHTLIKGKVQDGQFGGPAPIRVEYGTEDVYIPEGSGVDVARARTGLGIEAKVDRFGNAQARRILLDGRPLELKRR